MTETTGWKSPPVAEESLQGITACLLRGLFGSRPRAVPSGNLIIIQYSRSIQYGYRHWQIYFFLL